MKNFKFLSMTFMLMVALVSFTACGSDDDDNSPAGVDSNGNLSIIGSWKYDTKNDKDWDAETWDYEAVETITFNKDNTGQVTGSRKSTKGDSYSISYKASFIYILTWKDGIGTLKITEMDGESFYLSERTYTLNGSGSYDAYLTATKLHLGNVTYDKQ